MKVFIVSQWNEPFQSTVHRVTNHAYTEEDEAVAKFTELCDDEGAKDADVEALIDLFQMKKTKPQTWNDKSRERHVQIVMVEMHTVYT